MTAGTKAKRHYLHGTPIRRLMARTTVQANGCWLWSGSPYSNGYSRVTVYDEPQVQRSVLGHRLSYEHHRGPIPDGLVLDHLCRNRACVNPWHLELVTQLENTLRGDASVPRYERQTCSYGHDLTDDNVIVTRNAWRVCRVCRTGEAAA